MPLARLNLPRSRTAVPVPRARPGGLSLRSIDFNPPVKSIVLRIILLGAAESGIFPYKLACLVFDSSLGKFFHPPSKPKTHVATMCVRVFVDAVIAASFGACVRSLLISSCFFGYTRARSGRAWSRKRKRVCSSSAPQNEQEMSFEGA